MTPPQPRSTAQARSPVVVSAAVTAFAAGGWTGTTIADVARTAGISSAYVLKLFPTKERLFVAALEECFSRIEQILLDAARSAERDPDSVLAAMGDAYVQLITDRSLLLLQVHAQSASTVPAIGEALRHGVGRIVTAVSTTSRADDAAIQLFFARGQLCHLALTAGVMDDPSPWARLLTAGLRH